jgi:hypothetical protein
MDDYRFKDKDPIIDVLRTIVETYASIEGIKFSRALHNIEEGTNGLLKFSTTKNWFYGATKWPQYRHVARMALFLRRYSRRPIQIGDRKAHPVVGAVRKSA